MTVIKIQTEETFIPIEFGKLNFKFDTSDDSIQAFYKAHTKLESELGDVEIVEGEELSGAKEVLEKGYNVVLGNGAFEKVYKQTPSSLYLTKYLFTLMDSIAVKIEEMGLSESQQAKVEKYIAKKKK